MRITYDPTTGEIKEVRMGNEIVCPAGLSAAWVHWPEYAKTCKVLSVENGWAELEVVEYRFDLESAKTMKKAEFQEISNRLSNSARQSFPLFENPVWGILYEEACGLEAGTVTDSEKLLIHRAAVAAGKSLDAFKTDVLVQINTSRVSLSAIASKYLSLISMVDFAETVEAVLDINPSFRLRVKILHDYSLFHFWNVCYGTTFVYNSLGRRTRE